MNKNTHENILARCAWLKCLIENGLAVSKDHVTAISTMKKFADLEIKSSFSKISYNTLKAHAKEAKPHDNPAFLNYWDLLLHLREAAHTTLTDTIDRTKVNTPSKEDLRREALLQAHLCSSAYLEIFTFLENLKERDKSLAPHTINNISKFLKQTTLKYENILSHNTPTSGSDLILIKGGKSK